ncbi:uncharacterized protein MEPE_05700 [Melanopsichium pennsylvanicum]|uniref:Uncharacterized protein n=1 Tax=Melanopsichium pennsylvanicum TaxID=63383 RepID=A0AAJ4XSC0_9BASI|nr:uncharacterized protein MEPE_05700 [Melanopsichium pennsylvanicum]
MFVRKYNVDWNTVARNVGREAVECEAASGFYKLQASFQRFKVAIA